MYIDLKDYILKVYEVLHNNPEKYLNEFETSKFINSELERLGYSINKNPRYPTASMVTIDSGKPGPHLAIRSDISAMEFQDLLGTYYSHACRHDATMAMILGIAKKMNSVELTRGKLSLIIQPGKSILACVKDAGLCATLRDIDEIVGIHLMYKSEIPMGNATPAVLHGASWNAKVTVLGKDFHAARPQYGINPINTGLIIVQAINALHFDTNIPHSITATGFNSGGVTLNLIPKEATINIDIRAQTNELMEEILQRVEETIRLSARSLGARASIVFTDGFPAAKHDPKLIEDTKKAIESVLGLSKDKFVTPSGESFHIFSNELNLKTSYIGLGCDLEPFFYSPNLTFNKEALINGTQILYELINNKLIKST